MVWRAAILSATASESGCWRSPSNRSATGFVPPRQQRATRVGGNGLVHNVHCTCMLKPIEMENK